MRLDIAIACALSLATCEGRAQPREDEAVAIARLVVHEAGLDGIGDAPAIVAVLRNSGARVSMRPAAFARIYAPRFSRGASSRAWVYRLDAEGSDPHAGIRWPLYRERWLAILDVVRAALAADGVACEASDWGSRADMARRAAQGRRFRVVDCGATRNVYSVRGGR